MEKKQFIVKDSESGLRIDQYLALQIPTLSRRKIRGILDVGGCYVNNKRMHIASRQVHGGDKVRVEYSLVALSAAKQKTFVLEDSDVLFDDQHIIAINKPPGLPSQATRDQDIMHAEVCLKAWLKAKKRPVDKLILLHRLDKETSGILLFSTNSNTAIWVTEQFKQRSVHKTYWALCYGIPKSKIFKCECYLSDIDNKTGKVSIVHSGGRSSLTHFEVLQSHQESKVSWIKCSPETGRSHQIRVHLESCHHPILGDKRYGVEDRFQIPQAVETECSKHQMLHARSIRFTPAPNAPEVEITAKVPLSFETICSELNFRMG